MAEHNDVGRWGEVIAREYLLVNGYTIAAENFKIGRVEVDIIAYKDAAICFVEVKTRTDSDYDPADAVDAKKRQRLVRAADTWVRAMEIKHEPQFDIILITGTPDDYRLEHIPDAFFPSLNNLV